MSCGCGAPRKSACCCPKPTEPGCCSGMLLCDTMANGMVTPFVRIYTDDGCTTDLTIGGKPYATMGMVAPCTEDQTDGCDTTTPASVATLCLADGTPIVVVLQRDCDGVVTAPGWTNLSTGVYTAGLVPVGAAPCDSTVAAMATGLTLVDGTPITVVSQRDSDGAVTQAGWINNTTGVFTAGPLPVNVRAGGDAEPDLTVLCDVAGDGAVTSFVRQYRRNRAGDVIGTTNYSLTGAAYVPTGTVRACDAVFPCESPTTPISTTGLCLEDGTPVAVVSVRDCEGVITRAGWQNLITGVFTAGAVPAGTVPCDSTVATAESGGRLLLCDCPPVGDCVSFLRAIDSDGTVVDTTLAGLPYVPTGTVSSCEAVTASIPPCESPTTPIATTGLTLVDGTPITVVSQRDCAGVVTQTGWFHNLTGVFTAGPPPATVRAPGDAEPDLVVLCDTDGAGNITAFVRNYLRDRAGAVIGFADHTLTGGPYAVTGTVATCERVTANVRNPIVLCDTAIDGTVTRFLRDYVRDEDGVIIGFSDTLLDGTTPYVPVGTVADCETVAANLRDPFVLCDTDGAGTVTRFLRDYIRDIDGVIVNHVDFTLDGTTPYVPVGTVSVCDPVDVETDLLCLVDADDLLIQEVIAEYGYDAAGVRTLTRLVDPTTGVVVVAPPGATVQDCGCLCRTLICYAGIGEGEDCEAGVQQVLDPVSPTIISATIEANPNNFTVSALSASHNGSLADWTTITTDANGAALGLVLRYNFGAPSDIAQIRLDNNYGFDTSDFDGIGAATVTVFDAADIQLFQGPLSAGNGGAPFFTTLGGGVIEDAAYFTLADIVRQGAPVGPFTIGFREIAAVGTYRSLITWECPDETISALVEGVLPGVTYDGTTVTQTNPPHTFTFSSSVGAFAVKIVTDNEAAWSTLEVTDAQPVTTLTGNASLSIESVPAISRGISAGWLNPDGTVTSVNTGEIIVDPLIVPCVSPPENDHVITGHIVDMCEAGVPFLRQVRVSRDGVVQVIDTEIDGHTPYVITNLAAVTAGVCVRDRLGDVCAELGPLPLPTLVGFGQQGDCFVTQAANPSVTYNDPVDSIEFTAQGGIPAGPGFLLTLNGVDLVGPGDFTPPVPAFPGTVGSEYTATATVGGTMITATMISGAMSSGGNFGLVGRIRFEFSPTVSSVAVQTNYPNDPAFQLCDVVVLPSTASDPQQLAAFRSGDGTVTYYRADGTEVEDVVLLPCGSCCTGTQPAVQARGRTVTDAGPVWTPGADVAGAALSVTATGVTGTWTVTDAAGTVLAGLPAGVVLAWAAPAGDPLAAPQSIGAEPGGVVAVTWTER